MQSVQYSIRRYPQKYQLNFPHKIPPLRKRIIKIFAEETQQKTEVKKNQGPLIKQNGHQALVSSDGWQSEEEDQSWNGPTRKSIKTTFLTFQWKLLGGLIMLVSIVIVFMTQFSGKQKLSLPIPSLPSKPREAEVTMKPLTSRDELGVASLSEQDSAILEKRVDASELEALTEETGIKSLMQRTALAVRASASAAQAAQRAAAYASSAQTAASKAAAAAEAGCTAALKAQQALENGIEKEIAAAQAKAEAAELMAKQAEEKTAELSALATAYQDSSQSQAQVAQQAAKDEEKIVEKQSQKQSLTDKFKLWQEDASARVINLSNAAVGAIMSFFTNVWLYIESGYSWVTSLFKSMLDWIQSLINKGGAGTTSTT